MNEKHLKTIEYNKIKNILRDGATTLKTKQRIDALMPSTNVSAVEKSYDEIADALALMYKTTAPPINDAANLDMIADNVVIGARLTIEQLLEISRLLQTVKSLILYRESNVEEGITNNLTPYFDDLNPLNNLYREITRCIISEDEIADDASPALRDIRRSISSNNDKIRSTLNRMITSQTTRSYLQDALITLRDGRYCLPVRAEYKTTVKGIVHDQSQSGQTLFIEPMSVVELGNAIRELEIKEAEEIDRILAALSALVADDIEIIKSNHLLICEIDFIFAKATLAYNQEASRPVIASDDVINIKKARHPLIDREKVVPIDIILGGEYTQLIVTGPNTGGKTVSLKTLGLLSAMAASGLYIPAKEDSHIILFDEICADIGDEQSIEQSLSTFSSHMVNITSILKNINKNKKYLILFDELCAGTDPTEGAALARAILEKLHSHSVYIMATTHYSMLKVYASTTEGVENASCEFSVETLSPTYKLLIGIPGKSNAFAISKKLGLMKDIITHAESYISDSDISTEEILADIDAKRALIERDRREMQSEKDKISARLKSIEQKEASLEERKEKIISKANEEARDILRNAKNLADETIRDFNKAGQGMGKTNMSKLESKRTKVREAIDKTSKSNANKSNKATQFSNGLSAKDVHIGDEVKVVSINMTGTITSLPDKSGNLMVQLGIMNSKVKLRDIVLIGETNPYASSKKSSKKASGGSGRSLSKAGSISTEINLIGMNSYDAVSELDKYLDDAYMSSLSSVRVVHGKGSGALRSAIHQYLRGQSIVKKFYLAEHGQGDAGVTIVEFGE